MAGQMTVVLRSDPAPFQEGTDAAIKAIRDWETQTGVSADNASEKLEDAIRAVVDLGKQTDRSGEDIERALQGLGLGAEDAEAAVKAIEDETEALGRKAPDDIKRGQDALDDLGTSAEDAGDKTSSINDKTADVGDGLRDLGTVVNDVLKGDFGSAAAGAIEALGGIAGSIGGGVIGGAIATAVASIVGGWVTSWDEAAKESEDRIGTWADKFIEAQGRVLTEQQILSEVQRLLRDDAETVAKAWEIASVTGQTQAEVLRGLAGDADALHTSQTGLSDAVADAQAKIDAYNESGGRAGPTALEARDSIKALSEELAVQSGEMDSAATNANLYAEAAELGKTKTDELAHSISELPTTPTEVPVKVTVDDSAWKLWKPSKKFAEVVAVGGAGGGRQLIQ